jgi:hypothetical protein
LLLAIKLFIFREIHEIAIFDRFISHVRHLQFLPVTMSTHMPWLTLQFVGARIFIFALYQKILINKRFQIFTASHIQKTSPGRAGGVAASKGAQWSPPPWGLLN